MKLLLGADNSDDGVTFLLLVPGDFSGFGVWGFTTSASSMSVGLVMEFWTD
jgi:hypothetical protein